MSPRDIPTGRAKQIASSNEVFKRRKKPQNGSGTSSSKMRATSKMTFEAFYELYKKNMQDRIKLSTWKMKESVIESKILPYFRKKRMCDIKPRDVVTWQNTMLKMRDDDGNPYSPVYLKTIHNQLSAIFNHAVKFYDLPNNPAQKAGNMGKEKSREMLFWTQEEYKAFAEAVMDKPISFYAFEVLYWGGLRLGELLALTRKDIDFKRGMTL